MRRFAEVALCAVAVVALQGVPVQRRGQGWSTRVAATREGPESTCYSSNQIYHSGRVYEPLVRYAVPGGSSTAWPRAGRSPDGKVYTFHLPQGVTFSDGAPWNTGREAGRRP